MLYKKEYKNLRKLSFPVFRLEILFVCLLPSVDVIFTWRLGVPRFRKMTSYFDEHDCEPLGAGQGPDHFMHFARLLIDSGAWNQTEFAAMFQDRIPPPTSKRFIKDLKDHLVRVEGNLHH